MGTVITGGIPLSFRFASAALGDIRNKTKSSIKRVLSNMYQRIFFDFNNEAFHNFEIGNTEIVPITLSSM
jgi:hypothetical protein